MTRTGAKSPLGPGREFDLIRRFLSARRAVSPSVRVDSGDDAAVLDATRVALTVDVSVEGVHFRTDWLAPHEVGARAAASALSDLAAMAAAPLGVLVSLVLDPDRAWEYGPPIMDGVNDTAARFGISVIGGDVSRAPAGAPIVIDVACVGEVDEPALRSGGRPGDDVWVTGTLGGSAAALRLLEQGRRPAHDLRRAYAGPEPRIREAMWLAERVGIHAMIDVSDGLMADAGHLAAASDLAIRLDPGAIPLRPGAREAYATDDQQRRAALVGGEDFELCVLTRPGDMEAVAEGFRAAFGLGLTKVGSAVSGTGVHIVGPAGEPATGSGGYDHFATGR